MSDYSVAAEWLSRDLRVELFYCTRCDDNLLAKDTYLNGHGQRFCRLHKIRVRASHLGVNEYRTSKPTGSMCMCGKPPRLCSAQVLMVEPLETGKRRLKVFCSLPEFKTCLLDVPENTGKR